MTFVQAMTHCTGFPIRIAVGDTRCLEYQQILCPIWITHAGCRAENAVSVTAITFLPGWQQRDWEISPMLEEMMEQSVMVGQPWLAVGRGPQEGKRAAHCSEAERTWNLQGRHVSCQADETFLFVPFLCASGIAGIPGAFYEGTHKGKAWWG